MPKHHVDRHGRPLEPPRTPRWMRHHASPAGTDAGYIVRMRLVNGYWSYRPDRIAEINSTYNPWNTLGHLSWKDLSLPQRQIRLKEGAWIWDGVGAPRDVEGKERKKSGMLKRVRAPKKEGERVLYGVDRAGNYLYKEWEERKNGNVRQATPEKVGLKLRDDPVESGMELARGADQLPSDGWRGRGEVDHRGVSVISREELEEMEDLQRAIRASEEDARRRGEEEEPVYSVRVIPLRKKGKGKGVEKGEVAEGPMQSALVVGDIEEGSWDELFEELEAQGWVPVDGWAEGENADELASIAESWIMAEDEDDDEDDER
ncbi:hypothetical protein QBC34DRAFT_435587 [Podospora aff. communis PSN243]|uniref:Uncharacterized protein n=1 Tax=Podospora aff. communis PSN243 TaxID=3040156 RepID=A0AAV9GZY2_9PEZI|nr:hypothetical protein QBC34DRAFT_435587 [Podospora aff. communis PSN243]